jgi:hypothetical protein
VILIRQITRLNYGSICVRMCSVVRKIDGEGRVRDILWTGEGGGGMQRQTKAIHDMEVLICPTRAL